jgi:Holliday junction resolvasome RuvABC endonuclease subunit
MHLLPANCTDRAHLISIDPGSNTLGFCLIEFSVVTYNIYSTQAMTFVGDKMNCNQWFAEIHGARFSRIQQHRENLYRQFITYLPIAVVSESPFYSSRHPQAFEALLEVVAAIRQALFDYDPNMTLDLIDPPSAKKAVGAPGNAGKDDVHNAVLRLHDLNYSGIVPLECLDEHSIDAIAVGYSKILQYRKRETS